MPGTAVEAKEAEAKAQAQKSASDAGLGGDKGSTKETFTKSEVEELWKSREGKIGLKIKTERDTYKTQLTEVSKERDTFKGQVDSLTTEIADTKKEITDLTATIETLNSEDAAKVKQLIKDRERELSDLKTKKKNLEPLEQEVTKFKRDQEVYAVAYEYGLQTSEDLDAFMEAADDLGINDRGKLESLAKHRGLKLKEESEEKEPEEESGKPLDSGHSKGGGPDFDNMTPKEKIEYGLKHPKK